MTTEEIIAQFKAVPTVLDVEVVTKTITCLRVIVPSYSFFDCAPVYRVQEDVLRPGLRVEVVTRDHA